jgi:hypothetical protein
MRGLRLVSLHLAAALAAAAVLAQTAPSAAPAATPTPAPPEAASPTVSVGAPSPESPQRLSESAPLDPGMLVMTSPVAKAERKATKAELVVAPIPISDPACGSGLGVAIVYTFAKKATEHPSPPTTLSGGGFYTNNGTWAGAAAIQLYLKEDRYRLALAGALVRFNYDVYLAGAGREGLPISQDGTIGGGQFMVGLGKRWYAGVRVGYAASSVNRQHADKEPPPIVQGFLESKLVELGLRFERDGRDSTFYPTAGSHFEAFVNFDDPAWGSDFKFYRAWTLYSKFFRLSEPVVLAVEGGGCYASEGGPFYGLCMYGSKNLLQGYTVGQFLDRWMVAAQTEARWRFANRWLATGFVGVGEVQPVVPPRAEIDSLPAAGAALHWIAATENMITVKLQVAFGEGGLHAWYVGIGQSF